MMNAGNSLQALVHFFCYTHECYHWSVQGVGGEDVTVHGLGGILGENSVLDKELRVGSM